MKRIHFFIETSDNPREIDGYLLGEVDIPGFPAHFSVHRVPNTRSQWCVTDLVTGCKIRSDISPTMARAVEMARESLERRGLSAYILRIAAHQLGCPPLARGEPAAPAPLTQRRAIFISNAPLMGGADLVKQLVW